MFWVVINLQLIEYIMEKVHLLIYMKGNYSVVIEQDLEDISFQMVNIMKVSGRMVIKKGLEKLKLKIRRFMKVDGRKAKEKD
jgi:hypothetical protein